jgi:hypothetical protein
VRWSSFDMLNGFVPRTTPGARVEVIDENFLQFGGVRPGVNTLSFAADQLRAARLRSVRILPDSAIELTGAGPAQLTAEPSVSRAGARDGDAFRVRVVVANPSRRPARQIRARVDVDGTVAEAIGATTRGLPELGPDGRATATFALRARHRGPARIVVSVDSASSSPTASVPLRVGRKPSALDRVGRIAILVLVFGAPVLLVGFRWRAAGDGSRAPRDWAATGAGCRTVSRPRHWPPGGSGGAPRQCRR